MTQLDYTDCLWEKYYRNAVLNHHAGEYPLDEGLYECLRSICQQRILPHTPAIVLDGSLEWKDENYSTDYLGAYFAGSYEYTGCRTCYPMDGRRIELYPRRIETCGNILGREPIFADVDRQKVVEALKAIVMIHEAYHAILHLGVAPASETPPWTVPGIGEYMKRRLSIFTGLYNDDIEQHAQLATWHTIKDRDLLIKVFLALMAKQPRQYVIDEAIRNTPEKRLWTWMCLVRNNDAFRSKPDGMKDYLESGRLDERASDCVMMDLI